MCKIAFPQAFKITCIALEATQNYENRGQPIFPKNALFPGRFVLGPLNLFHRQPYTTGEAGAEVEFAGGGQRARRAVDVVDGD